MNRSFADVASLRFEAKFPTASVSGEISHLFVYFLSKSSPRFLCRTSKKWLGGFSNWKASKIPIKRHYEALKSHNNLGKSSRFVRLSGRDSFLFSVSLLLRKGSSFLVRFAFYIYSPVFIYTFLNIAQINFRPNMIFFVRYFIRNA